MDSPPPKLMETAAWTAKAGPVASGGLLGVKPPTLATFSTAVANSRLMIACAADGPTFASPTAPRVAMLAGVCPGTSTTVTAFPAASLFSV